MDDDSIFILVIMCMQLRFLIFLFVSYTGKEGMFRLMSICLLWFDPGRHCSWTSLDAQYDWLCLPISIAGFPLF